MPKQLRHNNFLTAKSNVHYYIFAIDHRTAFTLRAFRFEGDSTGSLHVGPGQMAVVQHPEDLELLVNIYVYKGGKLVLPTDFICHNINIFLW
ncbi:hypothetical protein DPMN_117908 [Dreissena polymorpha]|uniref:Uncharacterized protein n=1 Tax=Dreissena polymorpha TaxID=45954 RepID=A0A9D4GM59_DREPO|nr:hypothetical protein DPMN_117908 [Dreissena polymorpha]